MGKQGGKKFGRRHTTYIDVAEGLVNELSRSELVKKVSFGYITATPGKTGQRGVKIKEAQGGLHLIVRGPSSVQDIYVYTDDPDEVRQMIDDSIIK